MKERMQYLIQKLNEASDAYYNGRDEIMSNKEWDTMFDELTALEEETGIILPESPTQKVSADDTKGKKIQHEFPALSLAKTKLVSELEKWAENLIVYMSWKMDGLTLVLTYDNGKLTRIVTRGNGTIGTDITKLKDGIRNVPQTIAYSGHLVVRGEAVISYEDFNRINSEIENENDRYKNPRNLASGTLNLDDIEEVKRRNVSLIAFTPVYMDENAMNEEDAARHDVNSWGARMDYLDKLGFTTVERVECDRHSIEQEVRAFTDRIETFPYPVDGLVICYDDWAYSQTGSVTGHHATRAGFAFKWQDETAETVIRDIEWSDSRTGLFNPVAVFDPVELCGTTVSRASLFNLSYVNEKDIKIGNRVTVFKANMIIPSVDQNLDAEEFDMDAESLEETFKRYNIPASCPHCGRNLGLYKTDNAVTVKCINSSCPAKLIGQLTHFCERDCMNVMGVSKAKLQQLIDLGIVEDLPSLLNLYTEYNITGHITFTNEFGDDELLEDQEGWGKESVANLAKGLQDACEHANFIGFMHAMGIPNFGKGQAKLLAPAIIKYARENPDDLFLSSQDNLVDVLAAMVWNGYDFTKIDGFGDVIANSLTVWVEQKLIDPWYRGRTDSDVTDALKYITFVDTYDDYVKDTADSPIEGLTFVVTGDVHIFKNRKEVEAKIEELGGKLSGSVSKKTNYLINNDVTSTSGKNQKAKELGVPIISEEDFCKMIGM